MLVEPGEKVHVIARRNFDGDLRRHFAGEVKKTDGPVVRVEGYVFIYNPHRDEYVRRPERRARVFDLSSPMIIANVIPSSVQLETLVYEYSEERRLMLTDGNSFRLDINEYGMTR